MPRAIRLNATWISRHRKPSIFFFFFTHKTSPSPYLPLNTHSDPSTLPLPHLLRHHILLHLRRRLLRLLHTLQRILPPPLRPRWCSRDGTFCLSDLRWIVLEERIT